MFSDDELFPLSALQHYAFCPRQCALIHLEQQWTENRLTAEGRLMHVRVHERQTEQRGGIVTCRGLRLRSLALGVSGQADVVEFHSIESGAGLSLPGRKGRWQPVPVEYKRGKPKRDDCDSIQLCAQAICLEEMMNVDIPYGELFYGKERRRTEVLFDDRLRDLTRETGVRVHEMLVAGKTPAAQVCGKCRNCSFKEVCLPGAPAGEGYVEREVRRIITERDKDETA